MQALRTFIAVRLDAELEENLRRIQDRLGDQVAPRTVRWVRPEGIHLTLKFLGDTPRGKVDEVKAALLRAVTERAPFTFTVAGLGCFPSSRRPRVLWVGLDEPTGASPHKVVHRVLPGDPRDDRSLVLIVARVFVAVELAVAVRA